MRRRSMRFGVSVWLLACLALGAGCASVGRDFDGKKAKQLEVGRTTRGEVEASFGKPLNATTESSSEGKFEHLQYTYASANLASGSGRGLSLEFKDGVLNAYAFVSSFEEDATFVDTMSAGQIKPRQTSRDEVTRLLGPPHGRARCPTRLADYKDRVKPGTAEIWYWGGMEKVATLGKSDVESKAVYVLYDAGGAVQDVTVTNMSEAKLR